MLRTSASIFTRAFLARVGAERSAIVNSLQYLPLETSKCLSIAGLVEQRWATQRIVDFHATFSTSSGVDDYSKEVEEINTLFVAARDEIEFAQEESETVYFDESVAEAKKVVDECLEKWTGLLSRLSDEESMKLQRSMGLKMEQLKAEFEVLRSTHLEDH